MPGEGPASTLGGVETEKRRGWWAFAHHDVMGTAVPPIPPFNAYGAKAHRPRLSPISVPQGVDGGPEPVPGLVPGSSHDDEGTRGRSVPTCLRFAVDHASQPPDLADA